jgi:hypothetical protein
MVSTDEIKEVTSFFKMEMAQLLPELKKPDYKDLIHVFMYALYPDIVIEYKKIKANEILRTVDENTLNSIVETYNKISRNREVYREGLNAQAKIEEVLANILGDNYSGIKDPSKFLTLSQDIYSLRYKFGKDKENTLNNIKANLVASLGIDEKTANEICNDPSKCQQIATASNDFNRIQKMESLNVVNTFTEQVIKAFGKFAPISNFYGAFAFVGMILANAEPKKQRGDKTNYTEDVVNEYIKLYESTYEPFEADTPYYRGKEEGIKLYDTAISKNNYGNALPLFMELLANGADLDERTEKMFKLISETFNNEQGRAAVARLQEYYDSVWKLVKYIKLAESSNEEKNRFDFYQLEGFVNNFVNEREKAKIVLEFLKNSKSPRFLYSLTQQTKVAAWVRQQSGTVYLEKYDHSTLELLTVLLIPFKKFPSSKRFSQLVRETFNRVLLADKKENEIKQYYSENYLVVRSLIDRIKKILTTIAPLDLINDDVLKEMNEFMDKKAPELLKEGEKQLLTKLESIEIPKEEYTGADKAEIKKAIIEDYMKKYPKEKAVGVILTSPDWKVIEEVKVKYEFDRASDTLRKIEIKEIYRFMNAYVISERGDPFYWAYPIGIHSPQLQNGWGKPYIGGSMSSDIVFLSKKKVENILD